MNNYAKQCNLIKFKHATAQWRLHLCLTRLMPQTKKQFSCHSLHKYMAHLLAISHLPFVHQQMLHISTSFYVSTEQYVSASSLTVLLTKVVTVIPLQPLNCTWFLNIKDGWEWPLISNVQQPTPVTLQTYNDSCRAHIQCELSVCIKLPTGCFCIYAMG